MLCHISQFWQQIQEMVIDLTIPPLSAHSALPTPTHSPRKWKALIVKDKSFIGVLSMLKSIHFIIDIKMNDLLINQGNHLVEVKNLLDSATVNL